MEKTEIKVKSEEYISEKYDSHPILDNGFLSFSVRHAQTIPPGFWNGDGLESSGQRLGKTKRKKNILKISD